MRGLRRRTVWAWSEGVICVIVILIDRRCLQRAAHPNFQIKKPTWLR
jgi:hypothetical protein